MKLTVIGAGNMGGALIKGWAKSGKVDNITVADKNEALLAQFKKEYPALNVTTDNVEAVKDADIIVLVVKPWLMKMVLAEVKHVLNLEKQIVVSDAANFTTGMLAEELGEEGQFFYVIPNIAAEFGASMSFIAKSPSVTDENLKAVEDLTNWAQGERKKLNDFTNKYTQRQNAAVKRQQAQAQQFIDRKNGGRRH